MPNNNQPPWFDADYYATQKVAQHNVMYPGDQWSGVEQYERALAGFNATSWQNWFTEYGNADNVSPNPLFDEAYYFTALAQNSSLAEVDGRNDWTPAEIMHYLKRTYNASAWDHYTAQGQFEGLNPSRAFDTNAYFETRVEMLNEYNNGAGWNGKNDWSVENYQNVMREYGINPIIDLFTSTDYGQTGATMTITPVSSPLTPPADFTPWAVVDAPWEPVETYELTAGLDNFTGKAGVPTLFKGDAGAADSTIQPGDQIHGGANTENHLQIELNGNFLPGFNGAFGPNVTNIQQVDIDNGGGDYEFSARNMSGVSEWNLDNSGGATSLTGLSQTGITVNISGQAEGRAAIVFDGSAIGGQADSMSIGLSEVGSGGKDELTAVQLSAPGIERLDLSSNGDAENVVDLTALNALQNLVLAGTAPLAITAVDPALASILGAGATGDLNLVVSAATSLGTIQMGAGDDSATVSRLPSAAVIDGGYGNDQLVLQNFNASSLMLDMNNVERLTISGNRGDLSFDATRVNGLQTLDIIGQHGNFTLVHGHEREMTVNLDSDYQAASAPSGGNVTLYGITDLTLNLGAIGEEDQKDHQVSYNSDFTTWSATEVELNLADNAQFDGSLALHGATTLTVTGGADSSLSLSEYGRATDLAAVSVLNLNGEGNMDFHRASIGDNVASLRVNASGHTEGVFAAKFAGSSSVANQQIVINGGPAGNQIKINNTYNDIHVSTSGDGDDILDLTAFTSLAGVRLLAELGGGENYIYVNPSCQQTVVNLIHNGGIYGVSDENVIVTGSDLSGAEWAF